jgi:hypothetical protein
MNAGPGGEFPLSWCAGICVQAVRWGPVVQMCAGKAQGVSFCRAHVVEGLRRISHLKRVLAPA